MKHYANSDYALNKHSKGIVYRFADKIVEITLADYLNENPGKTEADFLALKNISDSDYHEEVKATYRQTWKDMPESDTEDSVLNADLSAEGEYFSGFEAIEENERYENLRGSARFALSKLTPIQRKRYVLYHIKGLTIRQIADFEGVGHTKIQKSIEGASTKIKKVLSKG